VNFRRKGGGSPLNSDLLRPMTTSLSGAILLFANKKSVPEEDIKKYISGNFVAKQRLHEKQPPTLHKKAQLETKESH
jgi:hypothetical protein